MNDGSKSVRRGPWMKLSQQWLSLVETTGRFFASVCHTIVDMTPENSAFEGSQNKRGRGRPPLHKVRVNLHLDVEGHLALQMLALHEESTMSGLVETWATREWRRRQWSGRVFLLPIMISKTVEKLMRRDLAWNESVFEEMTQELHDRAWYRLPVYRFWQVHRALAGLWWRLVECSLWSKMTRISTKNSRTSGR